MRAIIAWVALSLPTALMAQRVELPVHEVDLSDRTRRFTVTIKIDGRDVEAGLDTGSTGLRVLPRALQPDANAARGLHVDASYSSGTRFDGVEIKLPVAVGAIVGTIKVQRIDKIGCTEAKPDCPAKHVEPARFGAQGDGLPGEGFAAILGIRTRLDAVDNPFAQLGVRQWIVDLPKNTATTGRIVLNPEAGEIADYQRIAIDENGLLPGCIIGPTALGKLCGPTFFDTGAPGLRIQAVSRVEPWPQGTPAEIVFGDRTGAATMNVTIGRRDQASGMFYERAPSAPTMRLSLGLAPYIHWSVLYDLDRRQIGLKPR